MDGDWTWVYFCPISGNNVKKCSRMIYQSGKVTELTIRAGEDDFPLYAFGYAKNGDEQRKCSFVLHSNGSFKRIHRIKDVLDRITHRNEKIIEYLKSIRDDFGFVLEYDDYRIEVGLTKSRDRDCEYLISLHTPESAYWEFLSVNETIMLWRHKIYIPLYFWYDDEALLSRIKCALSNSYPDLDSGHETEARADYRSLLEYRSEFMEYYNNRSLLFRRTGWRFWYAVSYVSIVDENLAKTLAQLANDLRKIAEKYRVSGQNLREYKKFLKSYGIRVKNCSEATMEFLKLTNPDFRSRWEIFGVLMERMKAVLESEEFSEENVRKKIAELSRIINRKDDALHRVALEMRKQFLEEIEKYEMLVPYFAPAKRYNYKINFS